MQRCASAKMAMSSAKPAVRPRGRATSSRNCACESRPLATGRPEPDFCRLLCSGQQHLAVRVCLAETTRLQLHCATYWPLTWSRSSNAAPRNLSPGPACPWAPRAVKFRAAAGVALFDRRWQTRRSIQTLPMYPPPTTIATSIHQHLPTTSQ
jgi:hypothetical protein